ncbi:hypothetical protein CBR_g50459 [Chara braunii]|uniref:Reverse transcriptase domain-containing protein n=1 Tax=Chara braunii TaxID=69332 RepID=A0A388M6U7_CHABU|nr:hypothetical protein CBR_g50459 [Chara braunii]|eukprot:GBG90281.1 hypothetical protein CBR_g50459 [Chara braunii]
MGELHSRSTQQLQNDLTHNVKTLAAAVKVVDSQLKQMDAHIATLETRPSQAALGCTTDTTKQLNGSIDHVVNLIGDLGVFTGTDTISSTVAAIKTDITNLQSRPDAATKNYKMSHFNISKFNDYNKTHALTWWQGFLTEASCRTVPAEDMLKALYLQLIGGAQAWMNHLAATKQCTIAELHTHITWKEFEQLWFTRFMVHNVVKAAMNEVNEYDYASFQAILDRANLFIQKDDKTANEKQSHPHYVAKQGYQRPTHNNAVISEETVDLHAAAASSGDGGVLAALLLKRPNRVRKNKATYVTTSAGTGQQPWTAYKITKEVYDLRQRICDAIARNDIEEMSLVFLHALPSPDGPAASPPDPRISHLLDEYRDVFEAFIGMVPDRPIRHGITLEAGAVPLRGCIYCMSEEELKVLRAQLNDLLDKGWIRPSCSPYGAPVLFVPKQNKDLRLCIDYRKLNAQIVKNVGPLPRIDDLLEWLGSATYFLKLDLKSGYHQIEIHLQDRYKTAFRTRYGHFEWVVMPFGLTNAPATFQAAMTTEFRNLLDRSILIYLDNILVYSRTLDEHIVHLRVVLDRLRLVKYKASLDKCNFAKHELEYLGHYVTPKDIHPLADKILAIVDWS